MYVISRLNKKLLCHLWLSTSTSGVSQISHQSQASQVKIFCLFDTFVDCDSDFSTHTGSLNRTVTESLAINSSTHSFIHLSIDERIMENLFNI